METLIKAAALAVSVLASIFTTVETPKANTVAPPKMAPVFYGPPAPAELTTRTLVFTKDDFTIVIVEPKSVDDPASGAFQEWIKTAPNPKAISTEKPWFMGDFFDKPSAGRASEVLRALFTNGGSEL